MSKVETPPLMVRLHFEKKIHAIPGKVFKTMLEDKTYRDWTSIFNPTSYYRGSWTKGSKMLFLGTDENGKEGGMVSRIKELIPGKFVSIEHYGIIKDGKEVTSGPEVAQWAGGLENYSYSEAAGTTLLSIDIDTTPEFRNYFEETWPKALERIDLLCR